MAPVRSVHPLAPEILIFGSGGHAKVVADALGDRLCAYVELGKDVTGDAAIIGVGDNVARKRITSEVSGIDWIVAIHGLAIVAPDVSLGPGSVVMAGAIINPGAVIGRHCIINTGAIVDHDCVLADYCSVAPGVTLAGRVSVGEGAAVMTGSTVGPGVTVGPWSIVGAGSVVLKDVPERHLVFGAPAHRNQRRL